MQLTALKPWPGYYQHLSRIPVHKVGFLSWVIFESKLKITCHFFSHYLCTCKFISLWQESCSWVTFSCYSLACRLCRESCCLTSLLQYQSTLGMMEFPNGACDLYLSEEPVMLNLSVPDDKSFLGHGILETEEGKFCWHGKSRS